LPTEEATEAVTEEVVAASPVTEEAPSDTPEPATDTAEPATDTPEPSDTPEQTGSPSPESSATPPEGEPNIRLAYTVEGEFLLINISTRQVNLTGLTFEQLQADGTRYYFEANAWNDLNIAERPYMMGGGGCYQLLTNDATRLTPSRAVCPRFLGWLRTSTERRYFWIAGETFDVIRNNEILATCEVAAGECIFYLPPA
jgi:hypothetical protein